MSLSCCSNFSFQAQFLAAKSVLCAQAILHRGCKSPGADEQSGREKTLSVDLLAERGAHTAGHCCWASLLPSQKPTYCRQPKRGESCCPRHTEGPSVHSCEWSRLRGWVLLVNPVNVSWLNTIFHKKGMEMARNTKRISVPHIGQHRGDREKLWFIWGVS